MTKKYEMAACAALTRFIVIIKFVEKASLLHLLLLTFEVGLQSTTKF